MEKLKRIVFNVVFCITVLAIIAAVFLAMILVVMKLNVYAVTGEPASARCVVIDPGHGAEDGGAVSAEGLVEKDVNLDIALLLRDELELSGYRVVMTRSGDEMAGSGSSLSEKRRSDFAERLKMYNGSGVDAVVSIHQNIFSDASEHGAQIFYSPNEAASERLADCVRRSVTALLQPENERPLTKAGSNIYLLNNCEKPCVLVECGFLSNPDEAALLSDEEYRRKMAFAVYCGVLEFFAGN